jgi:hypothetical protein
MRQKEQVVHAYNPSHLEGGDWADDGLMSA